VNNGEVKEKEEEYWRRLFFSCMLTSAQGVQRQTGERQETEGQIRQDKSKQSFANGSALQVKSMARKLTGTVLYARHDFCAMYGLYSGKQSSMDRDLLQIGSIDININLDIREACTST